MNPLERLGDKVFKRLEDKIAERIRAGVSALHDDSGWVGGSFVTDTAASEVRVYIKSENDGEQGTVYAVNEDGARSREWAIPSTDLEKGVRSAAGAVYDVSYGEYTEPDE